MNYKIKCDRCNETFEKPETGRIRKIVDMSVHARFSDGRVNHFYYLCPSCASSFNKWLKYAAKRKEKIKNDSGN